MLIKRFFRRIADDFRQKELLPLKMLFFVHASTLFVLYPYLTIHMRELGISVEETAITAAVTPAVAIIMPPVAGMVADRIGNFKVLLAVASSLGGAAGLLLLLVPVGRYTLIYPEQVLLTVGCSDSGGLDLALTSRMPCSPPPPASSSSDLLEAPMTVHVCGLVCPVEDTAVRATAYTVRLPPSASFTFTRPPTSLHPAGGASRIMPGKHKMHLDDPLVLTTAIRRLPRDKVFLPLPGLFDVSCARDQATSDFALGCSIGQLGNVSGKQPAPGLAPPARHFVAHVSVRESEFGAGAPLRMKIVGLQAPANGTESGVRLPLVAGAELQNASCIAGPPLMETTAVLAESSVPLGTCKHACLVSSPRNLFCSDQQRMVEIDPQLTFWTYLVVRVFIGIIGSTAFAMFEGAVIAILREHKADYGLQRIYASIGAMISSPLSGMMIDYASAGKGYTDFRPAFYIYAALKIMSGVLMLTINLEFKAPAHNVLSDVMTALRNVEMTALFIACFVLGTAWGYIESFLFWLLQDLGASRSLMGITVTVGGIAGIPLLALSGPIIKKLGHANVLFVGFVFYAIRLLGYSLIYNPWLCLIFEAMESFTSSLAMTAAVTYAAALSSSSTDTSIQGLIGGLYYGVGKGSGSLIGGYLMKAVGTRATYRIFAAATAVCGVVYLMFNYLYLRRRNGGSKTSEDCRGTGAADDKETGIKNKEKDLEASQQVTDANELS